MEHVKGPDMDREAILNHLVAAYQRDLLRISYLYLRDAALAEDAVQETFFKAFRSLDSFRGESHEKTWLMRIAINTCKDMKKAGWFRFLDGKIVPENLPERPSLEEEDRGILEDILSLPAKWKEPLLLYYWENMSEQEIAAALGIGVSTVCTRLARARKKLRVALEGGEEQHEK